MSSVHNGVSQDIVIIGNGIAGNSAISAIRKFNRDATITLISEEPLPLYSPCVLSKKYLSEEMRREEVFLKTFEDYRKEGAEVILGQKAVQIDTQSKKVCLEAGCIGYDKLIIATGARVIAPPIEGVDRDGVLNLKSLEDADRVSAYPGENAVVIGSGPIGVEASVALRKRGWGVSIVELLGWMLPRIFDEGPSWLLRRIVEDYGIEVLTGERVVKIGGDGSVKSVTTDKRKIRCDMVILATGMRPEVELARKAGIETGKLKGIKVNSQMMTNVEGIYACGDCIESRDITTGENTLSLLWHNARQQGEIAGYNSVDISRSYPGSLNISSIEILGTYGVSIGQTTSTLKDAGVEIIEKDEGYYQRLLVADGTLVGAQFIGQVENMGPLISAIRRRDSVEALRRVVNNAELLSRNPWCHRMRRYVEH